ncbi:MAG: exonuclease subunit SbcD [Clostridiales bacterium]|nr:exonuclease subunit SbcD [Clostridiales bacterium]
MEEMQMRILHTADWHLGCKTDDMPRIDEQRDALKQIVNIAKAKDVDIVIIAGDIYDSVIPSSEAEDLFYKTVKELNNNGNTMVIAIAGNHDDPKRLSNASVFANNYGIYLIGQLEKVEILNNPISDADKRIRAIESGKGYIVFEKNNGEKAVVAYLPYPSYYRLNETRDNSISYSDKVKEWLSYGTKRFSHDTVNILTTHVLTRYNNQHLRHVSDNNNTLSATQQEFYGLSVLENSMGFVSNDALYSDAHYTALGHIHGCVPVNRERNIHYSGPIINHNFDIASESLTKVIVADLNNTGLQRIEKIPLDVKLLKKFTVTSLLQAEIVCRDNPDAWIKVEIENAERITIDEIKALRTKYRNLVTLAVITKDAKNTKKDLVSKKDLTNAEIFENFCIRQTGSPADPEVKELFLSLMSEDLYETD